MGMIKANPNPCHTTTSQHHNDIIIEETPLVPQTNHDHDHDHDNDHYTPLPEHPSAAVPPAKLRRPMSGIGAIIASVAFLISLVALITFNQTPQQPLISTTEAERDHHDYDIQEPRGLAQGVSAKSNPPLSDDRLRYNWTNAMFSWQRTAFHFQPQKNWMNDPNGPLFYKGWYHLFYQYNPYSAVWGNITWGHAVSSDLIHWLYLPLAMIPDHWYDINGVWTGSATMLPNGKIVMLYTGSTNESVQVQNLAYPANLSDPLLLNWVKYSGNPILVPPSGIGLTDFRDPTTAWAGPDGSWRLLIGSKVNKTGLALVYTTEDFITYNLSNRVLHEVLGTGMWECVDFYPLPINGSNGVDNAANGPGIKHVLKASLDDTKVDHYAIGTYFEENDTWVPDNPTEDVGIGLRVDYGRYYASKSFYDQNKRRRILWGWINETDTETDDLKKGWSSLQTIPRNVVYDNKTGTNILQWPVEEIEDLRSSCRDYQEVVLEPGSIMPLDIESATQLDISAEFEVESSSDMRKFSGNDIPGCGGGATRRDEFGPFGILVLADDSLSEMTPIYFRFSNSSDGNAKTYFCADETRSSKANDVFKHVYGSRIPVLDGEKLTMRVLVDHSIVESFGQGGRRVITSRIYPTQAIYGAARLFLFNNATGVRVKANLKIWQLTPAFIRPFPFDQFQVQVA